MTDSSERVGHHGHSAAGVPDVRGRALDPFGQVGEGTVPYVYIDTAPPLISPGSGPLVSESTTVDGQLTWDFCARDTNGTVAFMYSQVWIDGVAVFTNRFPYYYDSCLRMVTAPIARGNHTWVLHVFDHWGNDATRTGTVSVVRMLPTMTMPIVTIDPIVVGRINISTAITAQYGLSKIAWRVEPVPAGQTIMVDTYPNSTSDLNKPYSQSVNGLVPGQTYYAAVVAIANNGQAQSRSSVYFTIPTGVTPAPPVVYTEVERNDVDRINGNIPPANLVPSNVAEIRGTYNADTLHPINGIAYTDSDVFRITVPVGKTLHVSSPFKCDDDPGASVAQVSIWRFSPTNPANSSLGVLAAVADAHGALSLNVTSQLSFGSDEMMIVVDYPFYLYGPCSNPAYVLNVSVN